MRREHEELSRFSAGGKTFFFNLGRAKNGSRYLSINAMYGKGNMERLVIFPEQVVTFKDNLAKAIPHLMGLNEEDGERDVLNCYFCGVVIKRRGEEGMNATRKLVDGMDFIKCDSCGKMMQVEVTEEGVILSRV